MTLQYVLLGATEIFSPWTHCSKHEQKQTQKTEHAIGMLFMHNQVCSQSPVSILININMQDFECNMRIYKPTTKSRKLWQGKCVYLLERNAGWDIDILQIIKMHIWGSTRSTRSWRRKLHALPKPNIICCCLDTVCSYTASWWLLQHINKIIEPGQKVKYFLTHLGA